MGKFLKISEAARLTGQTESQLRRLILTILNHGNKLDKALIRQREDEDWEMDSSLLEESLNEGSKHRQQKDDILELISEQLKAKDLQIANIQDQMSQMIERNREMNVMLHKLQQHLAIDSGKTSSSDFQNDAEAGVENDEIEKEETTPTSFADWARRFRK